MPIELYAILIFAIGLFVGISLGYFFFRRNIKSSKLLENQLDEKNQAFSAMQQRAELLQESLSELKIEHTALSDLKGDLAATVVRLETEKAGLSTQISEHTEDLTRMREQFTKDFQLLANKIFEEKSEKFTSQNRISLNQLLAPLKENIASFQKKVEETHASNLKETSGLRQELKNLKEVSQKMSDEADNLTRALKNDSKVQGNWGEIILESILENSGLRRDYEYFTQQSFTMDDGRRLQPDVLIKLPENKCVIVDSKVSLKAYEQYISDEEIDRKQLHLKAHLNSIRAHIKGLAAKKYHELGAGKKLDFILMFIPIEPAYLLALNQDQTLFNEAYERHIVMVSPSTLIASLKIIASTWKHEYQNKNAQEIAKRGKLLLDKFVGFADDFEKIGDHISRTEKTYLDAMKKLRDGRGSLVNQARELESLGIKSDKQLGGKFTNNQIE